MLFFTLFTAFFRDLIDVLQFLDKLDIGDDAPRLGGIKKPKPKNDSGFDLGM